MKFARRVCLLAGIYGILVLLPGYFLEQKAGRDFPPAITHPEYYYGFIGIALAWQVVFLIIATDPQRYRVLLLPGILEKAGYGVPAIVLYALGRAGPLTLGTGIFDLILGALFLAAYLRIANPRTEAAQGASHP